MKKLLLMLLFPLCAPAAYAQNPLIRTDLIPNSPTAGSIAKAGEVPLNISTGLPAISIPIFNVQGNELSLPISLNYNYDGFKPAQAASWIGMGWNLDAGGVITVSIRDKADDTFTVPHNYSDTTVQNVLYSPSVPSQAFLSSAPVNYDTEPDLFSFNFPGYSGKFFMQKGKFYVFPSQKLKITGNTSGFVITTENGTKYFFDEIETTNPKGSSGASYNLPSSYNSAWYLSKIENAAGTEHIMLSYTNDGKVVNAGAYTQTYKKDIDILYDTTPSSPSASFPTFVNPKRLTSIISEKYTVNFVAGPDREDVYQTTDTSKTLARIEISSNTELIKKFRFRQSYDASTFKVLLLDSLQECPKPLNIGETGPLPDTLTHIFEYNAVDDVSRNQAFVDHYGFYTGRGDFAGILIPNTLSTLGVDRSPVFDGTKQGALTKITYPSGGYTSFNYELNKANDGIHYETDAHTFIAEVTRPSGGSATHYQTSVQHVTVPGSGMDVEVWLERTPYTESGDGIIHSAVDDFDILDSTGTSVFSGRMSFEYENTGISFFTTLSAGTYKLRVAADQYESYMRGFLNFNTISNRPIEGKTAGGLRLHSMETDAQSNEVLHREYSYTDTAGFSSGVAPSDGYSFRPWHDINVMAGNVIEDKYYNLISSYIGENYLPELPHYYTSVLEKQFSGTDTVYTRHNFKQFGGSFMGNAPTSVIQYRKNSSGTLEPASRKSYEYEEVQDTSFRALKAYQVMQVNFVGGDMYIGPLYAYDYEITDIYQNWKDLKSTRDVVYEGADSLVTVTTNTYDDNRNLAYTTTTASNGDVHIAKFKYPESYTSGLDSLVNAHVLSPLIEQQQWNKTGSDSLLVSAGVTLYSGALFRPVKQYLLTTAGISALNNESKTGDLYDHVLSDSRYEERARYSYNAAGRLISQKLTDGQPVSYLWGYISTLPYGYSNIGQLNYPIAEAKNALPAELYSENFEENGSATSGAAHSGSKYYSGDFSVTWSRPNGKDYVISFFYRSSGKWIYKKQAYTGSVTLSDGDAIDDVAIYPADAQFSGYTYVDGIGNDAMIDARGNMMRYAYDKYNRLEYITDQNGDLVKSYTYGQGKTNGLYYNKELKASIAKNDCTSGQFGTFVPYAIPAGTFVSTVSQAAADALAYAALGSTGQTYANAHGSCAYGVTLTYTQGPYDPNIMQVQVKDASGNVLETFDQNDLLSGVTFPQGTYTLSITIENVLGNPDWAVCGIQSGVHTSEINSISGVNTYTKSGVVLTDSTASFYILTLP